MNKKEYFEKNPISIREVCNWAVEVHKIDMTPEEFFESDSEGHLFHVFEAKAMYESMLVALSDIKDIESYREKFRSNE
jgi:hypothetical protein